MRSERPVCIGACLFGKKVRYLERVSTGYSVFCAFECDSNRLIERNGRGFASILRHQFFLETNLEMEIGVSLTTTVWRPRRRFAESKDPSRGFRGADGAVAT